MGERWAVGGSSSQAGNANEQLLNPYAPRCRTDQTRLRRGRIERAMSVEIRPARTDELERVHFVVSYAFTADRVFAAGYVPFGSDFF